MKWYKKALSKYFRLNGRSRRREFWHFHLMNLIIYLILSVIEVKIDLVYYLSIPFFAIVFIPSITLSIRRLHDINKSVFFLLFGLIPFLGPLILIYFFVQEGDQCSNKYGPDPKGLGSPSMQF